MSERPSMIQVSLATAHDALYAQLLDVLRSVDLEIVRAFESTTPERAGSGVEEYTIIVSGLSQDAVKLVCSGFVNRYRLALVMVDGDRVAGPRVIT